MPKTLRLDLDLVGTSAERFANLLSESNRSLPEGAERWTPSELAASLLAMLLSDDAAAESPADNVVTFPSRH